MWSCVTYLISEIKRCENAGATSAAVSMSYICIDVMSYLSLPADKTKQGRSDFIGWVDTYLHGHQEQPYQYRGIDVYGARCAMLHMFGTEADFHQQNPDVKKFTYHDGGMHTYAPDLNPSLVIIGAKSFVNDVVTAVGSFGEHCKTDSDLRARAESRLPSVLAMFPIGNQRKSFCSVMSKTFSWFRRST